MAACMFRPRDIAPRGLSPADNRHHCILLPESNAPLHNLLTTRRSEQRVSTPPRLHLLTKHGLHGHSH